jgi:hypothetical protein
MVAVRPAHWSSKSGGQKRSAKVAGIFCAKGAVSNQPEATPQEDKSPITTSAESAIQ